jgi:hypothetical protein
VVVGQITNPPGDPLWTLAPGGNGNNVKLKDDDDFSVKVKVNQADSTVLVLYARPDIAFMGPSTAYQRVKINMQVLSITQE